MYLQGLGSTGVTLAARLLTFPAGWYATNFRQAPDAFFAVKVPSLVTPDVPYIPQLLPRLGGNFPFGWSVEPDEHF